VKVTFSWSIFSLRWISRSREPQIDAPDRSEQEDVAAELKRLRRENEILRQERDILKRATAFFARDGVRP
jgi:transposase